MSDLMRNLQPGQRLRAHREANDLVDAAVTDPAVRAAVILAAARIARTEGSGTIGTRLLTSMSPRPHEAIGTWRERLAKAHGVEAEEVAW